MTDAPTLREALEPFAAMRLSTEPEVSDCVLRSASADLRLRAQRLDQHDANIRRARVALSAQVPEDDAGLAKKLRAMASRHSSRPTEHICWRAADRIEALSQPRELNVSRIPTGPAMGDSAGMTPKRES